MNGQFVAMKLNMPLVNDSALATEITLKCLSAVSSGLYVFITERTIKKAHKGHGYSFLYLIFEAIHKIRIKLRMERMGGSFYLSVRTSLCLSVATTVIILHVD